MQAQGQPNFAGVDFNQYQGWQRVTTPSGGVYYAVPGTSYVYDPFLSAARGQPVLWANPSQRDEEIARQREIQDNQIRQQERASSPEGQLLPIAGTVGGTVGSAYLINQLAGSGSSGAAATAGTTAGSGIATPAVVGVQRVGEAGAAATSTPGAAFTQGAMGGSGSGGGAGGGGVATSQGGGGVIGFSPMVGLGAGAVAAYYGPTYYEYAKKIADGNLSEDDMLKTAALTNPMTAWAVPIADKLGIGIKAGKHKDQLRRDKVREFAKETGFLDEEYNMTLADGSKFNIGRDGSTRAYNISDEIKDDPFVGQAIGLVNPLAAIMGAGDEKLTNDFAGYMTNGIMSNTQDPNQVLANARAQYANAGLDYNSAMQRINELEPTIGKEKADAYRNGVNTVFGSGFGEPQGQPQAQPQLPPPPDMQAPRPGDRSMVGSVDQIAAQAAAGQPVVTNKPAMFPAGSDQASQMLQQQVGALQGAPARSQTLSPGIDLQGNRIAMGKELARRLDRRL